jgi:holin-like protein
VSRPPAPIDDPHGTAAVMDAPHGPAAPMDILRGLAVLLLCQSAGEATVRAVGLPLPGPVLGLALLLVLLRVPAVRAPVGAAAQALLAHLSLLFVPVGVGVVAHLQALRDHAGALAAVLVLATWVGLAVTALVLRALWRQAAPPPQERAT